jgi:hypothetical protein
MENLDKALGKTIDSEKVLEQTNKLAALKFEIENAVAVPPEFMNKKGEYYAHLKEKVKSAQAEVDEYRKFMDPNDIFQRQTLGHYEGSLETLSNVIQALEGS